MNKKGFTLTEIVVVVLIIGILAAVATPTYLASVEKSKYSSIVSMVRGIQDSVKRCTVESGNNMSATNCTFDKLDIQVRDADGNRVTQARLDKTSISSGIMLDNNFYISYVSGKYPAITISREPYKDANFYAFTIDHTGKCGISALTTSTKAVDMLNSLGLPQVKAISGYVNFERCYI
ncbi:prepilin-type N-terminal cleavage/methylation domain-containing protein [Elusimicrobium simillimum]|uniref:prepilin-type N-terminal cleavage/methylation domain-containing protein n=1 Tax=Elusimicrobium simillimum TaxID=3143438 RepID=UPI003C6F7E3B